MRALADTTEPSAPRVLDDLLLHRLWRALRPGSKLAACIVEERHGITHREWGLVGMLAQIGEIRPSELSERMKLDRVRTSRALRGLFDKALVERRQDTDDRREVHVQLSAAGRQLYEDVFPRIADLNTGLLDGLDERHHDVLLECLRRVELRSLELNAQDAVPEKADRRAGGTRRHWPRNANLT
ncbi:MarR family winged helix-turn-helix transcriptional regulator [Variovorax boronicumulans]|uniref:MarR family winged helix-turn-helix transcriptional regulator n=1 Tax=Variovorax boronicumulans TaxID=436515 RepID=UPI0027D7EFB7|nr:MarR family transcriptional regulator [Variovorax boronicumulans]